jgi:glucose/arabinose dehydrogenase
MGDGGAGGAVSQDLTSLLGKLLRLDVSGAAPYVVPGGNPYAGGTNGERGEIWASGLRNPWRIAFDDPSDRLYVADVGETALEEINIEPATADGLNYGWNIMEGTQCFGAAACSQTGLTQPKFTYDHSGGRCSITGGAVYRGDAMPTMRGHYFYADLCQEGVRSLRFSSGSTTDHRQWDTGPIGNILSFGTDGHGEMHVTTGGGGVYRLVPTP